MSNIGADGQSLGTVVSEEELERGGEDGFLLHMRGLAERARKSFKRDNLSLMSVQLTRGSGRRNALAYARPNGQRDRYRVLVTGELLDQIRTLAGQAPKVAEMICAHAAEAEDFRVLWGDLPTDEAHFEAFGELLGTAALTVLMNHELAHIAFQHEVVLAGSQGPGELQSQALELDADMHALDWTRIYLEEFAEKVASGQYNFSPQVVGVCRNFVEAEAGRRFLLVASAWLMFLSFSPSGLDLRTMDKGTHPRLPIRLCTLLHAEAMIAKRRNKGQEQARQVPASVFALLAYTYGHGWCRKLPEGTFAGSCRRRQAGVSSSGRAGLGHLPGTWPGRCRSKLSAAARASPRSHGQEDQRGEGLRRRRSSALVCGWRVAGAGNWDRIILMKSARLNTPFLAEIA